MTKDTTPTPVEVTEADRALLDAITGGSFEFRPKAKRERLQMIAAFRLAAAPKSDFREAGDINWKAEWEAASFEAVRFRDALNCIADLGCCGKAGGLQSAIDIAVSAITAPAFDPSKADGGEGPYTCRSCCAATWNDSDVCDTCEDEATRHD